MAKHEGTMCRVCYRCPVLVKRDGTLFKHEVFTVLDGNTRPDGFCKGSGKHESYDGDDRISTLTLYYQKARIERGIVRTFKQAMEAHLSALREAGWTVKDGLKTPHATSPDGLTRLWFKPQAVYAGRGSDFGEARSILGGMMDSRTMSTADLVAQGAYLANTLAADKLQNG